MAGTFSFLPLSNKPGLKARVHAKGPETKTTILPEHRVSSTAEVEVDDKDDEWYDTTSASSEDGLSPAKKNNSQSHADIDTSVVTMKPISPDDRQMLLPYMPALFSTDLPPCGLEVQVAYEQVNAQLRERWLSHRGQRSAVDICQDVHDALRNQNYLWPAYTLKGRTKKRKPWRRENVFKYELSWIEYFLREAQQQDPELMTESELMDRKKQSAIPFELKFNVERPDVMALWDAWNVKKRAKYPALPVGDVEIVTHSVDSVPEAQREEKAHDNKKEKADQSNSSSEKTSVHHPNSTKASDDAHFWSEGGHD